MRKLLIYLSVSTELEEQDVIDMLVDGLLDKAGALNDIKVNGKKFEINETIDTA